MTTEDATAADAPVRWENRLVGFDPAVDPAELTANPLNARRHPEAQMEALRESLARVGWVGAALVNRRTGLMIDGHARVEEALAAGETVPVLYADLSEDEERWVLATFDPISAMAQTDAQRMTELLESVQPSTAALSDLLVGLSEGLALTLEPWPEDDEEEPHDPDDPKHSDGSLLDLINVTIGEPTHQVKAGEVWRLGPHTLAVCDLMREWRVYTKLLADAGDDAMFVPYPGPFAILSRAAATHTFVMVQPNAYIAGHVLDRWAETHPDAAPELVA